MPQRHPQDGLHCVLSENVSLFWDDDPWDYGPMYVIYEMSRSNVRRVVPTLLLVKYVYIHIVKPEARKKHTKHTYTQFCLTCINFASLFVLKLQ